MLADAAMRYKHLNTSKPITIRVNQLDLIKLKAKAKAKNIPYQTLLSSLIRDFADGDYTLKISFQERKNRFQHPSFHQVQITWFMPVGC
jgi:hypothetical protein